MLQRTPSIERYSDYLFNQLDDLTSRARILRSEALRLETEKASIVRLAHKLSHSSELQHCAEVDREDIRAAVDHTRAVLESITVSVRQLREASQEEAWQAATHHVDILDAGIAEAVASAGEVPTAAIRACLEAVSGDTPANVTDVNFQSMALGCTLDDQKSLRLRLSSLLQEAESAAAALASLAPEELARRREEARLAAEKAAALAASPPTTDETMAPAASSGSSSEAPATEAASGVPQSDAPPPSSTETAAAAEAAGESSATDGADKDVTMLGEQSTPLPEGMSRATVIPVIMSREARAPVQVRGVRPPLPPTAAAGDGRNAAINADEWDADPFTALLARAANVARQKQQQQQLLRQRQMQQEQELQQQLQQQAHGGGPRVLAGLVPPHPGAPSHHRRRRGPRHAVPVPDDGDVYVDRTPTEDAALRRAMQEASADGEADEVAGGRPYYVFVDPRSNHTASMGGGGGPFSQFSRQPPYVPFGAVPTRRQRRGFDVWPPAQGHMYPPTPYGGFVPGPYFGGHPAVHDGFW